MEGWQHVEDINTIKDTLELLEWRLKLAREDKAAIKASHQANQRESKVEFVLFQPKISTCSEKTKQVRSLEKVNKVLATSIEIPFTPLLNRNSSEFTFKNFPGSIKKSQ